MKQKADNLLDAVGAQLSRRDGLRLGAASIAALSPVPTLGATQTETPPRKEETVTHNGSLRPFHVNFPEAELTELRRRVSATRWPDHETVRDTSQGVQLATVQALASYWAKDHDWRKAEARLN